MEEKIFLTQTGLEKLQQELSKFKEKRRQVVERIKTAREFGDLAENSEYEDARNEQSFIEGRIQEIEEMLKNAKVLGKNGNGGNQVELGSIVTLKIDGKNLVYELVGATESDPALGKISIESPLGYSLMGKVKGENVEIQTPTGKMKCKIIEIK